jgi:hypothetical protein
MPISYFSAPVLNRNQFIFCANEAHYLTEIFSNQGLQTFMISLK